LTSHTIKSALAEAHSQLEEVSDSPAFDSEILLAHCLNKNRSYLYTWPDKHLTDEQLECFKTFIDKRKTDYPIAYLVGTKAFWTLDLIVTPDVLIPRPETELLVEIALEKISNIKQPQILDLGTGSGAIALSLASERPDAIITASDYSAEALDIAKKNAYKHKLIKQVMFIESDWFECIPEINYDLIVSNPPYIAPHDPHLSQTIRYEPQQALVAENNGMSDIETLIRDTKKHLKTDAWIIIEHGYNQSEETLSLFKEYGFAKEKTYLDISNNPRISCAQNS